MKQKTERLRLELDGEPDPDLMDAAVEWILNERGRLARVMLAARRQKETQDAEATAEA